MRAAVERIRRCAGAALALLLLGETGTGKTSLARFAHAESGRTGPLVEFDCASADGPMIRRDLHGHRRGAFTGATDDGEGLIEAADRGTLFLDEVGELPLADQPRLLRAVESGTTRRIGRTSDRKVDVWFVSATNVDVEAAIAARQVRPDLFFRLGRVTVVIPPLRDRPEDIEPLVRHWCATKQPEARVEQAALDALARLPWPGNVRQLHAVLDSAWLDRDGGLVRVADLPRGALPGAPDPLAELMRSAVAAAGGERAAARALGWSWGRWCYHKRRLDLTFD